VSGPLATFADKERRETFKTWRLWVVPGILLFVALTSPVLTRLTPEIIKATTGSQHGIVIHVPTPTARDSYEQFMGNLAQLVILAVIIAGAATISAERRAGTAVLVLTKPISRAGFVLVKAAAQLVLLVGATVVAAAVCVVATVVLFGSADIGAFVETTALWLVFAAMILMLMVLLSAALRGQAQAIGAGIALWIGLFFFTGIPLLRDHSPAGLIVANDAALRGRPAALLWPLVTTALTGVALLAGAVWAFRRREL
jgi:ABC-2 type transport system permease protein